MPITVAEKWESRERTDEFGDGTSSLDLIFVIQGTDDDQLVVENLLLAAPLTFRGLERINSSIERIAEQAWLGKVTYSDTNLEDQQVGGSDFQFDTTGQSQHQDQSLETTRFPNPSTNPDIPATNDLIGDTGDFVEGVDIIVPTYSFSETHRITDLLITPAYKSILFFLTGSTNDAVFKGFETNEVLFLGASGSKRGRDDWSISYRFAATPNRTGFSIGPIDNINKKGWEYLTVRTTQKPNKPVDPTHMILDIQWVDVHELYPEGDFSLMGIGI